MNLSPLHIWASMGPLSKVIATFLMFMALASIAVIVERVIALVRGEAESKKFAEAAGPLVGRGEFGALAQLADKFKGSPLARLVGPVAAKFNGAVLDERDGGLSPVERARREAARMNEAVGSELRRGMSVLASVGSVAPFVGLLGTVVGIITAFQGIASTGSGGLGAVSAGISEALIETALGLMVAIPAVLFFNYLNTRIAAVETALGRSSGELLDEMEHDHGRAAHHQYAKKVAA
jgi:biopolymer transport protein ExbB